MRAACQRDGRRAAIIALGQTRVNFLFHRHLAVRELGSAAAGLGSMLPDLWRMADRRVRPAPARTLRPDAPDLVAAVLAGIEHHLDLDRWFHAADVFVVGERATLDALRRSGVDAPKLGLFAHVTWEMCLDGALVRRQGLDATTRDLAAAIQTAGDAPASAAASLHHFDRVARTDSERASFDHGMRGLFRELAHGAWIAGYMSGPGIARKVDGMRARLGFTRLSDADRAGIGRAIEELAPRADDAALEILDRGQ